MKSITTDWNHMTLKNTRNLGYWTFAWVSSMALASFGPKLIWDFNNWISSLVILFNLAMGFGMILAQKKWLNSLDELQIRIQLNAMAIALGVGIVGGLSYSLLDISNLITMDAEIGILVMLISLTYLGGTIIGTHRYK